MLFSAPCPNGSRPYLHFRGLRDGTELPPRCDWWRMLGQQRVSRWADESPSPLRCTIVSFQKEWIANESTPYAETRLPEYSAEAMSSVCGRASGEAGFVPRCASWRYRDGGWRREIRVLAHFPILHQNSRIEWHRCLCRWRRSTCGQAANPNRYSELPPIPLRDDIYLASYRAAKQCVHIGGCWSRIRRHTWHESLNVRRADFL